MARKPGIPVYRNKDSRAVVTLPDQLGNRTLHYLGVHGSPESKNEYARHIAEWQTRLQRLLVYHDLTVNELIILFWKHVEQHYRHPDGTPTGEADNFRYALKPVRRLYGYSLANNFGPLALKAVRQVMLDADLCRSVINRQVVRIRMMFRWAVAEELIGPSVFHALKAVDGLKLGRSCARETNKVLLFHADVEAILPFLDRFVSAMVQVQRLTGMRPGEICSMRRNEIDMSGSVWMYRPTRHKTSWRGKSRTIGIGPKAQEILKGFFTPAFDDYVFSPIRAREERFAAKKANRQTPVQPSQVSRKKIKPRRIPGDRFERESYTQAIRRGCEKAGILVWKPNQLRHAFGTDIRRRFGLEGAQVGLGHAKADVTQVYAKRNEELAAKIASEVG